ncbi:MAG: ABC transporter substrate-binding protein, partial [Anaerolineae bacterium]|nr:ABC transporter substrate-binding protein [Anaerolineae bacterium]
LEAVNGCAFTSHYYGDKPSAAVRAWVARYEERFLMEPDALATLSYDAADLLFTAIAETGVVAPDLVARTLETLTFDGIAGSMAFDALHNPVKSMVVLRVEGGQVRFDGRFDALPQAAEE